MFIDLNVLGYALQNRFIVLHVSQTNALENESIT